MFLLAIAIIAKVGGMETIRKINDDLAISGQITSEELRQLVAAGYKSVLNLRSPDEDGFQSSDRLDPQLLDLQYVNLPVKATEINPQIALEVFQIISELPKPTLVHCDNGMRSSTIIFMYIATKQGISLDLVFRQAINLGLL
ncbi:MAG: hypothetical protein KME17_20395 [Cyanosarcina radialis HA8281-LM2]|jgi:uncharacterized protein (TIGR01244 family)|nr:hypothetical protein [Cyanosarcina radialis HA8281-LM2]